MQEHDVVKQHNQTIDSLLQRAEQGSDPEKHLLAVEIRRLRAINRASQIGAQRNSWIAQEILRKTEKQREKIEGKACAFPPGDDTEPVKALASLPDMPVSDDLGPLPQGFEVPVDKITGSPVWSRVNWRRVKLGEEIEAGDWWGTGNHWMITAREGRKVAKSECFGYRRILGPKGEGGENP